eukprot:352205-Chlamydomonas_euryale.AAC.10
MGLICEARSHEQASCVRSMNGAGRLDDSKGKSRTSDDGRTAGLHPPVPLLPHINESWYAGGGRDARGGGGGGAIAGVGKLSHAEAALGCPLPAPSPPELGPPALPTGAALFCG